jgi:hypothetical protein
MSLLREAWSIIPIHCCHQLDPNQESHETSGSWGFRRKEQSMATGRHTSLPTSSPHALTDSNTHGPCTQKVNKYQATLRSLSFQIPFLSNPPSLRRLVLSLPVASFFSTKTKRTSKKCKSISSICFGILYAFAHVARVFTGRSNPSSARRCGIGRSTTGCGRV